MFSRLAQKIAQRSLGSRAYATSQNSLFRVQDRKFNFVMIILAGAVSSELAWIIRTRNETERVSRQLNTEIKAMDRVIERLEKGEKVDIEKELFLSAKTQEDVSIDALLDKIEELDASWKDANTKLPTAKPVAPANLEDRKSQTGPRGASSSSFL